jgi:hypothetical protein
MIWGALSDKRVGLSFTIAVGFASAVLPDASLAGVLTVFYCLRFETPPTWRARSPYLYPPGTGWPSYTPRHWFPFSSPPTTRRATVEVFEPASTREVKPFLYSFGTDRIEDTVSNTSLLCDV